MKLKRILCGILTLLLMAGCTVQAPGSGGNPTTQFAETTAPTESVLLDPVSALSFHASEESPQMHAIDSRTVAFVTSEYAPGDFSKKFTRIQVVDLYTDTVTSEKVFEEALSLLPLGAAGGITLCSEETGAVQLLDGELQLISQFQAEILTGVLSQDQAYYYYVFGSELRCLDIAQEEVSTLELDWELPIEAITGYEPEENLLLVTAYTDHFATDSCVGVIDLDTQAYYILCDAPTDISLTAQGVCMETDQAETLTADVTYYSWNADRMYSMSGLLANNNFYSTWHVAGSDYIFQIRYDEAQNSDVKDSVLLRMGEEVSSCSLQEYLKGKKLNRFISLPDGNLLALAVTRRGYQPFLICPEQLEFTVTKTPKASTAVLLDEQIREHYQQVQEENDLPGPLRQARTKADEMEAEYGVTILLSSQCGTVVEASSAEIVTSDQAELANENELIWDALNELEDALEMYPEDFFRQFQNEAQQQGVLVMLVGNINMGQMGAAGVSYVLGDWYPVAVDITTEDLFSTYCHEFWHATEFKINQENPELLTDQEWSTYNPPGFVYTNDQTGAFWYDLQYTLLGDEKDADIYFIDGYGKTFAYEDRARLMEYTMHSDRYARLLLKYPAMRKKLNAMADAVREVFDTTGWGTPYWERYL